MSPFASLTIWRSGPSVLTIAPPAGLVMNLARGWITPLPSAREDSPRT